MSDDIESSTPPPAPGLSAKTLAILAGFVALVVACEVALAYVLIPSAEQVQVVVGPAPANDPSKNKPTDAAAPAEAPANAPEHVEVDLGKFQITVFQPTSGVTTRLDFQLVGAVAVDTRADFESRLGNNQHRLRDQIMVEMRDSSTADLTEPGLGLIKRRILEKSNVLLGKPYLQDLFFSQFTFLEE